MYRDRTIRSLIDGQQLVTLPPDTSIRHTAIVMAEHRIGAVPVVRDGLLVGMFTERDLMNRVVAHGLNTDETKLEQVMTRNVSTVSLDRPVIHALHLMHENGFRHLPVVDGGGRVVGMMSARDAQGMEVLTFERDSTFRDTVTEVLR